MTFTIHDSPNQKGLFTSSFIEKNSILFPLKGAVVHGEAMKEMEEEKAINLLQVLPNEYISLEGTKEIFINHSCNPNAGIKTLGRKAVLIAIRIIKPNEEITFDYSSTSTESREEWEMECNCKAWNCRKLISGFQYLNKEEQKYLIENGVVPEYVQNFVGVK